MTSRACLFAALVAAGSSFACGGGDGLTGPGHPIRALTRNLYLGTDFGGLAFLASPADIPATTAMMWGNVQASNIPERAKLIAAEIVDTMPDLVALQEVTHYRMQTPSDGTVTPPNATETAIDFLALVMAEIDARGGGYRVAGEALNADAEFPVSDGAGGTFDLRVADRDVILARDGVQTSNFIVTTFNANLAFEVGGAGGIPLAFDRSCSRLDAVVGEASFTFGNAHLEIGALATIQMQQAQEMLDAFAPIPGPMLLLGDFNSPPGAGSYQLITQMFKDASTASGPTCCQASNLANATSSADDRIDLVLTRGRFRHKESRRTGDSARTPGGLWASDHFGAFAVVELVP
jgi:endonuclease/exonuclease/phosphatase family metal-dependent hydrolase